MSDFVRPIRDTVMSDAWGVVRRHEFELRRRDGEWQRQVRETYDRGDGAAVLLCDRAAGEVILTRQFRYPAYLRGGEAYVIEACAGKLEGDPPEICARKEALEETGHVVGEMIRVFESMMSPGSVTEVLTLYIGFVAGEPADRGGGLVHEGEDIEVIRLPFARAMAMVEQGEIHDAKTVMLLLEAARRGIFG